MTEASLVQNTIDPIDTIVSNITAKVTDINNTLDDNTTASPATTAATAPTTASQGTASNSVVSTSSSSQSLTDGDVADLQHHLAQASAAQVFDQEAPQSQPQLPLHEGASLYYDAASMTTLNAFSLAALNRLRAYKPPPFPLWDALPVRKRAAVLILLYADRWGDLRVVITMRAASLRSFSGHAALPGGKADSKEETPYQIARREAYEEIGLPMDNLRIPKPFRIEQLCCLPPALARTHLVVTPCVAYLHADRKAPGSPTPLVEESMIPRLDAREVAAVFSAPFYNFLKLNDLPPQSGEALPASPWYDGTWMNWKDEPWRVHNFYVPVNNQKVSRPRRASAAQHQEQQQPEPAGKPGDSAQDYEGRFKVWGMTGRVLVDAARIAYDEIPEMEHNEDFGDIRIINRAEEEGVFDEIVEQRIKKEDDEYKPAKI